MIDRHRVRAGTYRALCDASGAAEGLSARALAEQLATPELLVRLALEELRVVGLVIEAPEGTWAITEEGLRVAARPAFDPPVHHDDDGPPEAA